MPFPDTGNSEGKNRLREWWWISFEHVELFIQQPLEKTTGTSQMGAEQRFHIWDRNFITPFFDHHLEFVQLLTLALPHPQFFMKTSNPLNPPLYPSSPTTPISLLLLDLSWSSVPIYFHQSHLATPNLWLIQIFTFFVSYPNKLNIPTKPSLLAA